MFMIIGVSILLVLAVVMTSIIPIILPITIGLISYTIIEHRSIRYIILLICLGSLGANHIIRRFDNRLIDHVGNNRKTSGTGRIGRGISRVTEQLKHKHHPLATFGLIALGSWSALPDIILTRLVRHKVNFLIYSAAMSVGKLGLYIPIIRATLAATQGVMMMMKH